MTNQTQTKPKKTVEEIVDEWDKLGKPVPKGMRQLAEMFRDWSNGKPPYMPKNNNKQGE